MIYTRTETHQGSDCLITKDAHIVPIFTTILGKDSKVGEVVGYVATCSTIYKGWMGFDTKCQSFVFNDEKLAKDFCEEYFKKI